VDAPQRGVRRSDGRPRPPVLWQCFGGPTKREARQSGGCRRATRTARRLGTRTKVGKKVVFPMVKRSTPEEGGTTASFPRGTESAPPTAQLARSIWGAS
jgi:hypothetical protein